MSATTSTTYTILPASVQLDTCFTPLGPKATATEDQMLLHYTVREPNGAEMRVSVLWNKRNRRTSKVDYPNMFSFGTKAASVIQLCYLRQATLREKQAHGIRLTSAELKKLRYAHIAPRSRVCIKQAPLLTPAPAPRPAPTPVVTPAQLAASNAALQTQITRLTDDVATLRTQLQRESADKARLTQQLAATQRQLETLTAAFGQLLTQQ
jgi:hypothetical protein